MRATACIELGRIGLDRARPALTAALKDHRPNNFYRSGSQYPTVAEIAQKALDKLGR